MPIAIQNLKLCLEYVPFGKLADEREKRAQFVGKFESNEFEIAGITYNSESAKSTHTLNIFVNLNDTQQRFK